MLKARVLLIIAFLMSLLLLCSCGDFDSDVPVFYIKNGTEAYDPVEEMIDNFYSTFYDEVESDEPQESDVYEVTEAETTAKAEETTESNEPDETETTAVDTSESTAQTTDTTAVPSADSEDISTTVYWVKNGEVWHLTDKCSSLSRSKNILSGSVEDAINAGKARACKRCGG